MNKIFLTGRLSHTPDFKVLDTGLAYCKISIAVDSNMPNKKTNQKETYFFNCIAWSKTAEYINSWIGKGRLVIVEGELKNRSYQKQDGTKAIITEIAIERIEPLDKAKDNSFQGQTNQVVETTQFATKTEPISEPKSTDTEFDPFAGEE